MPACQDSPGLALGTCFTRLTASKWLEHSMCFRLFLSGSLGSLCGYFPAWGPESLVCYLGYKMKPHTCKVLPYIITGGIKWVLGSTAGRGSWKPCLICSGFLPADSLHSFTVIHSGQSTATPGPHESFSSDLKVILGTLTQAFL